MPSCPRAKFRRALVPSMFHFSFFFILNYLNTKSLQQYKVTKEKSLITIIHYNIYIFTVYLSKTYLDAAARPGSRVFVLNFMLVCSRACVPRFSACPLALVRNVQETPEGGEP